MSTEIFKGAHFIGIGGAGMSGIARILLAREAPVSGSDAKESPTVLALRALGARIGIGQRADNLDLLDDPPGVVVVSSAIREDNPELVAARERGIPVIHRSQALAALMAGHKVVCVAGTHGKTSTTSMVTVALQHCRLDPSFAIGGDLNESGSNAHHGSGGIFVAEADESDGSFLAFSPDVAIVTNVEADHLDHHGTVEAYTKVFDEFLTRITPGGTLIACADDPGSNALADRAEQAGIRVRRYGFTATGAGNAVGAGFTPVGGSSDERAGGSELTLHVDGADVPLRVAVPGEHMALDAIAALLAGLEVGAPLDGLLEGLAAFGGVRRRFEFKGRSGRIRVYDDYAHNPTKVSAQLKATRLVAGEGRLIVVFQPHLYSRTRDFATEFGASLALADEVIVLDVYGAREEPIPEVTGKLVADAVTLPTEQVHYEPGFDRIPDLVADLARDGDLVLTMGAGDVTSLGPEIITALDRRASGVGIG
ncbi:MAG TPA: UDP-N-acetylmuramate--L-alanine ligase [Pseudonocardiaceae bacterium]|jgi:UDP-N-acetylmuramate--alanine ligase|nr:UDP-N-acetylmuramate--L-alanine ligase [Pseudonocardiaceae bacterium]